MIIAKACFSNLLHTAIVEKRINDFERIIDNDLYAYVDKALILEGAIYVNYGSQLSP